MNTTDLKPVPSVEEIRKARKPLIDVNAKQNENLSSVDRLAVWITNHIGSMGFFLIIFVWTIAWLGWNLLAPEELVFDSRPAFVLWLFISNMIQMLLLPLIMIGQNIQSRHAELRAEADFQVNQKSEQEIELILQHLENQNKMIAHLTELVEKK
ncbi:MAG: DUF1003 domain-containing protein [Patescibacteria group bacterium]